MTTASLSPKYQIVIPKEIRKHHKLRPGQKLQIVDKGGEIVLRPTLSGEQLMGILSDCRHIPFEREPDHYLPGRRQIQSTHVRYFKKK
ncbi:MAG: AbrB/MazE/SpoVT family DNA-binding domain-containing protein [Methylacidiphilales bacterium]|nr:AbrB/MazE/SpoVT family DNA-binding domain-containing protein [Candidatus Methylacidiphilales bacterium]